MKLNKKDELSLMVLSAIKKAIAEAKTKGQTSINTIVSGLWEWLTGKPERGGLGLDKQQAIDVINGLVDRGAIKRYRAKLGFTIVLPEDARQTNSTQPGSQYKFATYSK